MLQIIKRTLRTIFGIYAAIVFACSLLISSLLYFIVFTLMDEDHSPAFAHRYISRPWASFLFIMYGIRVEIRNRNFLERHQPYVFIANHRSQLDIPAYAIATNHIIRFLAKAELNKIPLMGYIIGKLYISVDRKDKAARSRSMENMLSSLRRGISVFICPEGTRNKGTEPLLPFHDGAFRLAIQAQMPLAILVVKNAEQLLSPLRPVELAPGKIICQWCPTISTRGLTQEDLPSLKDKAIELMTEALTGRQA